MEKIKTKQKILNTALQLFNIQGIEYIGTRNIADEMKLDIGYITGHFTKKEYIVNALSWQFSEKNSALWNTKQALDYKNFFDLLKNYFHLQLEYRCLFISLAHLHTHQPEIAERTKKEELQRKNIIKASFYEMIA